LICSNLLVSFHLSVKLEWKALNKSAWKSALWGCKRRLPIRQNFTFKTENTVRINVAPLFRQRSYTNSMTSHHSNKTQELTIPQALGLAIEHYQAGRLSQADALATSAQ